MDWQAQKYLSSPLHPSSTPFDCFFFPIKTNYGIALGDRGNDCFFFVTLSWGTQSVSKRMKQSAVGILVSAPHTLRFLIDQTICSFIQTQVSLSICMRSRVGGRGGGEACICFSYVKLEVMKKWDCGGMFVLAVWALKIDQAAVYISLLHSPPVSMSQLPLWVRWLDELHLGKWMLLISTPCYMEHFRTWWVQDKTTWWISRHHKLSLLLS